MNNRISTGYFLAVIATVIWAGNFIVARALNQEILPIDRSGILAMGDCGGNISTIRPAIDS